MYNINYYDDSANTCMYFNGHHAKNTHHATVNTHSSRYPKKAEEGSELQDSEDEAGDFGTPEEETCEVRPDIYLNHLDERELFITRDADVINQTDNYEMIVNAPRVVADYDAKKKYCPKYQVTWYMEKPASSQIITTFAPLVFTAGLACLNVMNAAGEDGGSGPALDNSIALCLTIVFVLPNLRVEGRGDLSTESREEDSFLTTFFKFAKGSLLSNNAIVFLFFVGLAFTSVAHPLFFDVSSDHGEADEYIPLNKWYVTYNDTGLSFKFGYAERFGLIGMVCLAVSLLIPLLNWCRYLKFKKEIRESGYVKIGSHGAKAHEKNVAAANKKEDDPNKRITTVKTRDDKRLAFASDMTFDKWELPAKSEDKDVYPKVQEVMHSVLAVRNAALAAADPKGSTKKSKSKSKSECMIPYGEESVWKPDGKCSIACGTKHS